MSNKSILAIILIIVAGGVYYFTKDKIDTASKDETVKLGIIYGYTGPIESLTPNMAKAAELAITEVNNSGNFIAKKVEGVRADSTCVDAAAATSVAERLITSDKIKAIVGAACSGATTAILQNVAMANGIAMISPSATSPALSDLPDNDLFFRTAPSDARQGEIIAELLLQKGFKAAAMTYTNNDYGKGLADSIKKNYESRGGKITISASHEDGKGDYGAEAAALAQAGGDILIVAGYLDKGGKGVIQASLDAGSFKTFYLPDGMIGDSLPKAIGKDLNGSIGTVPGTDSPGATKFNEVAKANNLKAGPYTKESYDSAALIMLAMQAANSTNSNDFKSKVMDVANTPGEKIYPGELAKGLKLLSEGKEIDYVGASAVELIGGGESAGNFAEILIDNQKVTTVGYK